MLKTTVPFRFKKEVAPLIEAGADELYCGYLPSQWVRRYTNLEFERKGPGTNFTDLKELKTAVETAHKKHTPVYLTLNGLYVQQQYGLLHKILDDLKAIDFDGYIVADLGLLLTLRKRGFKKQIHISTGGTVFNHQAVGFYRELGVSRIVLDRQVSLEAMRGLSAANPDIGFEVFILHTLCVYIDGFCTFLHMYGSKPLHDKKIPFKMNSGFDIFAMGDACTLNYSVRARRTNGRRGSAKGITPVFYKRLVDGIECGACALYDIAQTKVTSVKIVGRQLAPEVRLKSVEFISRCLGFLRKNREITRKDFISRVQGQYAQTFAPAKKGCKGNNCYHPEVIL